MTRSDLLKDATRQLNKAGWEDPRSYAERLLSWALDAPRYHIYLHPNLPVKTKQEDTFRVMLHRALQGEPLEYITGRCEFYGIELAIKPGVLIPRPETELLIDHAKRIVGDGVRRAMDIGCGSGAITLALFEQNIAHEVVAVDISMTAIQATAENAGRIGFFITDPKPKPSNPALMEKAVYLERASLDPSTKKEHRDRLWLIHEDAFSVKFRPPVHPFPLIVSNPPYVSNEEWVNLPTHIRVYEPSEALRAGDDGLDIHRRLTRRLKNWLSPAGAFIGEIGAGQGDASVKIHQTWAKRVELHKDYASLDRIVIAHNK